MRVLCVGNRYPPWSLGGYEVTWQTTVAALRDRGHEVRVLITLPDPTDLAAGGPVEPDVHRELAWYWRAHAWPRLGLRQTIALERANRDTLTRHLADFDPDVVMWWAMGGMSLSLIEQARRDGRPMLGAVGDDWMSYGPLVDRWTRRWRGRLRALAPLAERATGVPSRVSLESGRWLFNSEFTRSQALAAGWRLPEAGVLHPGVDLELFEPAPPAPWAWRLLVCGRLDPRKGIDTAIEALRLLPEAAQLTIAGEGDPGYGAELRALVARLGLTRRVRFTSSSREQLPALYAQADALVFPVRWREPWGLVPLEAMACGRPVVASQAGGGAWEYLIDGENCVGFAPGDPPALAAALQALSTDSQLRDRLRSAGLLIAQRHSEETFHRGLTEAVEALG